MTQPLDSKSISALLSQQIANWNTGTDATLSGLNSSGFTSGENNIFDTLLTTVLSQAQANQASGTRGSAQNNSTALNLTGSNTLLGSSSSSGSTSLGSQVVELLALESLASASTNWSSDAFSTSADTGMAGMAGPSTSTPMDLASSLLAQTLTTGQQSTLATAGGTNSLDSLLSLAPTSTPNGSGSALTTESTSKDPTVTKEISTAVTSAAQTYGLPVNLIRAVIHQESGGNPNAVSSAGAIGLMQLMPETAKTLGVSNPYSITENINGGSKYLSELLQRFGGNIPLALAAYNAGPNAVAQYKGIPPYTETQHYVKDVLALMNQNTASV